MGLAQNRAWCIAPLYSDVGTLRRRLAH